MNRSRDYGIKQSSDQKLKRLIAAQAIEHSSDKPKIAEVLERIIKIEE